MCQPSASPPRQILIVSPRRSERAAHHARQVVLSLQAGGHTATFSDAPRSILGTVDAGNVPGGDAHHEKWDAVIVIGAEYDEFDLVALSGFAKADSGVRIQHVVDDATQRAPCIRLNQHLAPHAVILDAHHWPPGSFTDFEADRFAIAEREMAAAASLSVIAHDGRKHYTYWPELGLHGKWPRETRLEGLGWLLERARGASMLDLGAAEGVVAREFLDRGASFVHGFDLDAGRVATARSLCRGWRGSEFRQADLADWSGFLRAHGDVLNSGYDLVLYLGLHHHLPVDVRRDTLSGAAALARNYLAVRTTTAACEHDRIDERLAELGFKLAAAEAQNRSGPARIYRRQGSER